MDTLSKAVLLLTTIVVCFWSGCIAGERHERHAGIVTSDAAAECLKDLKDSNNKIQRAIDEMALGAQVLNLCTEELKAKKYCSKPKKSASPVHRDPNEYIGPANDNGVPEILVITPSAGRSFKESEQKLPDGYGHACGAYPCTEAPH